MKEEREREREREAGYQELGKGVKAENEERANAIKRGKMLRSER